MFQTKEFRKFEFLYHFSILKKEFYESIDQKIYHKIPLNPPLPAFGRIKRPKGETLISSLWQTCPEFAEGGRSGGVLQRFSNR